MLESGRPKASIDGRFEGSLDQLESIKEYEINGALEVGVEKQLICFLSKNQDIFAWASKDVLRIYLNFLFHFLSIVSETHLLSQKKKKLGKEKRKEVKEETDKLLAVHFIREV
ncbi:hypothetical protein CR513_19367, partial [Mucuna pruriens]